MDKEELRSRSSLGKDFLTYVCYQSDKNAGLVKTPGSGQQFSLWVDGKIVLEDDRDPLPNMVSHSGDDFTEQDLKQAIRSGKKVREARFRIEQGASTWSFTLRAERFEVSGLKIDMPGTRDIDEKFFDRMLNIEEFSSLMDGLYEYFINEVHQKTWKMKGYQEFQRWLQAK
jgi:recombination associated protein RdgC